MKNQPVKIVTFGIFLTLVGGFVAYRAGAFEKAWETKVSLSDIHVSGTPIDTPGTPEFDSLKLYESRDMEMMSSSKSMVIRPVFQDTARKKTEPAKPKPMMYSSKIGFIENPVVADTPKKEPELKPMMGGSKSAIIFEPKPKKDTSKPKTDPKMANPPKKPMMGGTKSAYIYEPSDFEPKDTTKPKQK